ncbi:HNH endonuclease protein [Rhizobium phage RHph_N28_1]|nr:HNH endonuclease protein [Rhizobium phage RHph_N28_1]QIG74170.1 HNH endonuclease protein [Rhizobium phage RHph_N42]QXV73828.1 HNH endonuclease protein [Rhizobium phage RHph_N46]
MSKIGRPNFRPKGVGRPRIRLKASSSTKDGEHPYGADWPEISAAVRKRDNYKCQAHKIGLPICSNRFPPPLHHLLHAHHIIRYAKAKKHNMKYIISLCVACHNKEHRKMVAREATDKQKRYAKSL